MTAPRAAAVLLLAAAACAKPPAAPAPFTDPAAHHATRIAVAPGVRLEVLDWGGSGPALVFLAGMINTGHVFDTFAPRFTDHYRVIAITRRGSGASDAPEAGPYDALTLAADVRAVMDSLGIAKATLVGHSFGGMELSWFDAEYPDRVEKLIYLDSSCSGCAPAERPGRLYRPPGPPMESRDSLTPAGLMAYQRRTLGFAYPEAEVRAINRYGAGRVDIASPVAVRRAVAAGSGHPGFARIRSPALGIFAERSTVEQEFWWARQMNRPVRALAQIYMDVSLANRRAARGQFEHEMPHARVAVIPGAHHFVFLSNPDQTERLMREFLAEPDSSH